MERSNYKLLKRDTDLPPIKNVSVLSGEEQLALMPN